MLEEYQLLVQPIHTAIAGRARYKIAGLWRCQSLKRYLELQLSAQPDIFQVRGSVDTGNLLVIFSPHLNHSQVAKTIQNLVHIYRQNLRLPPVPVGVNQCLLPVMSASSLATILSVATGIIYSQNWDELILLNIQKLHDPILDRVMLGTTLLGEPAILLALCWSLPQFGFFQAHPESAQLVTNATLSAIGLNLFLKYIFARERPLLWERLINVDYYSFPSGHAMVSIVTYGMIAYFLAQAYPHKKQEIFLLTFLLISAIGFSRLYLGVHWFTDVTAGYAFGLLLIAGFILMKGKFEQSQSLIGEGVGGRE